MADKKSPKEKREEKSKQRKEWTQAEIDAAMAFPKGKDEDPPKRGPGQPSKYSTIDLERVQALAAGGLTKYEIADACGIAIDTLMEYQKKYPEFSAAIERGRQRGVTDVVSAMHKVALGYVVPEEKLQYDMQTGSWARETVLKAYPPDVKAQHLILQHSETGSWKQRQEITLIDPIAEKLHQARERAKRR